MTQKIKEFRINIDGITQLVIDLTPSAETTKAINSLKLAKAWLGKVLEELGNENPYKSGYKTKDDIEPTADSVRILSLIHI